MTKLYFSALEPRVLLDAAAVATVASEVTHHDQAETKHQADAQKTSDASSDASSQFDAVVANLNPETATGRVLVVIDSRVEGAEEFAASLEGKADVLIVDSDQSGAKAIADALASGTDVSGLHIISHGGDGSFELGSDHIDSAALASEVGSEISSWSSHLSAGADILLYGCNIAKDETGKQFVDTFSSLTGADIAASDDVTGNTDLGGDWDLEYATGQITATLPADSSALHSISQLLADPVDPVTGHQPTISGMGVSQNGVEDTAVTLGGISVGDIDHDASNVSETLTVTITVVDGSSNPTGSIALNGTAGLDSVTGDNGNTITLVGKQDAINAALNNMVLTPSENYNGTVNVHLTVNDGTTGDVTDTITVNLSPVNDAPDMSPSPVSVDEGGSVTIGTDIFNLTDPELGITQTASQEVFQVTALPTEGVLKLNGNNLLVGSTFSLQDVISGKLTYKHDGTDIIVGSNDVDGFKVTVNDGGGSGNVGPFDVAINIAPVNQAPTVDGSPTVHEGEGTEDVYNSPGTVTQAAEIGSLLNISGGDADSADDLANMTITISEVDNQGHGTLFIDTDGDGIFNSGIDQIITGSVTISGADIGKLKFAHNGTEPDGNSPSFKITITDGGGGAGDAAKASVSKTITIGVIGNDDNPEIDTNSPQTVDAGVVTVLSSANLKVTDIDDTSGGKQLVYKITSLPTYGELRLNGVILSVGDRFSQDDLDNGRVTYFQTAKVTAADRVSGENYVADGFSFEVRDSQLRSYNQAGAEGGVVDPTTGNIKTNSFELRINGDWTGDGGETPDGSVTIKGTPVNSGLQVTEEDGIVGGADTGTITSSMLNYILQATSGGNTYDIASSDTIYRLTDLPTNGKLYLNGVELHVFDSFTQADIDANNVTFVHDGSEDHQSSFGFSLSVGVNEIVKTTFSLRATATNDAPTVSGGTATVAEGSAVGLTTSSLGMADADTSNEPGEPSDANDEAQADDLYIQITTLPQNGTLQYLSNGTWIDIQAGDWISAKLLTGDENTTGIRYLQTVDAVASDSFEYRVRDDFKDNSDTDTDDVRSSVADPDANHVSGNGTVNLTITSVDNHAPTINGNPKAYEGQGSENLYNDNSTKTQAADIGGQITIADFDSYDDDTRLTVSITNVDTHGVGTLFLDVDGDGYFGAGDTQITGDTANLTIAQLKTLKFIHDGAEPSDATDPSFTLTVTDSGGGFGVGEALSTSKNIVIDILANDDYSSLDTNNTAQIDAGQSFVIDTSYLSVSDVDDTSNGTQLVYEVTDLPDHGELRLNGVRLTLGDRFSQADVAAGKLVYVQNGAVDDPDAKASGTAFTADSFDFKVYDSQQRAFNNDGADGGVVDPNNNHEIVTNTFNIEIQGDFAGDGGTATSSDPVTIVDSTNNGIDVVEGDGVSGGSDTHTIASSELNYELKYTQGGSEYTVPADATVYRISSLPTNGTLYVDGKAIDSLYDSFTQDDIDNNRVVFVHDGGEIHQGSFGFTISVGTSEAVAGTFALRATATNDAPTATGGTLADVTQGATVGITTGALGMSDVDVANETGEPGSNPEASSDDLFFKVTDLPDGGKLQYYDDGTSSWVDVGANDWLSAGLLTGDSATTKLRYVNDSGIALSADNFKFIVRDDLSTVDGAKQTAADPATGNVSAEKQVSWNIVASVNHAPTIDGAPSVYEGQGTEDVYNNPGTKTSAADIGGQITIGDVDTSDSGNLGIVISDIDTHGLGTLFLDANGNGQVDSGEAITGTTATLTMAEFKTLKFAHNGTEPDGTTKPEFKLTVTDAGGEPGTGHELTTAKTIQIDVIANDDHSVLDTNKPTTVQAGVSTVITRNFLHVSDVDDTSNGTEIVYQLTSLPTYGELRLNGNLLTVNSTFTQADIDAGRLTYVQTKAVTDSDNSTAGTSYTADSFNFEVRDSHSRVFNNAGQAGGVVNSADGTIATNTFNLQIQGSYDPDAAPTGDPVVIDQSSVNTGIEVYEGDGQFGGTDNDTVTITSQNLSYTLKATQGSSEYTIPAEGTVYRLTTLPQNGTLYLNGKALGIYDSFTQADINNGLLKFTHDGGETHHGSFNFSISIGTGQLADDRAQGTFTITAIPVNDAPTADGGSVPTIGEGATVTITTGTMKIGDVDNQAEADEPYGEAVIDDLYFQIVDLPDTGTLQYKDAGGNWVDVQAGDWLSASLLTGDKNTTGLRYIHDGTENFTDSFQFRVRDDLHSSDGLRQTATDPATINTSNNATVNFTIAPLNDAPISDQNAAADSATTENGRTTVNEVLEVSEGGTGTISDSYLVSVDPDNAPETLQYRITQNVTSGVLYLDGKRLGVGSVFTQADIDAGRLTYIHDGSEVRSDNFQYIVSDSVNDHTWTVDGTKAASQFDIIVPASGYANDVPKITRAGADYDVYGTNTFDMDGKFTLSDPDLVVVDSPGETDFVSVTVVLKDKDGNAVDLSSSGDLALGTLTGITVTSDVASSGSITFQGSLADVQAALNSMNVVLPDGDHDTTYTVEVSVDDRLRDSSGNLTAGANGSENATVNQDGSTINDANNIAKTSVLLRASSTNTPPTIDVPNPGDARVTYEDTTKTISGIRIDDTDAFGKDVTVTLSVSNGRLEFSAPGDVTISGNDSGTVTLTGSVTEINAIMDQLTYAGNQDYVGSDVLSITVNDLGNSGGPAETAMTTVNITVKSVNDAPTITNGTTGRIDVVNNNTYTFGDSSNGFIIDDIDLDGGAGDDAFVVTVRILDPNGNPVSAASYTTGSNNIVISSTDSSGAVTVDGTYNGVGAALRISGSEADINNYLKGLQVNFGDFGEQNQTYKVQVIVDDRMPASPEGSDNNALESSDMANGGPNPDQTPYESAPNIDATPIDPYTTDVSASNFQYNVAAVTRDVFLTAYNTPAKVTGNNFSVDESNGVINVNGSNANLTIDDVDDLGQDMSVTLTVSAGSTITGLNNQTADGAGITGLGGTSVTLTGFNEAELNAILKTIVVKVPTETGDAGSNSNFNGDITLTVAVNDLGNTGLRPDSLTGDTNDAAANPGDYAYADGSSAELVTTRTITITVNPTNDAPTISAGTTSHNVTESNVVGTGTPETTILDNVSIGDVDLATTGGLDANTFGKGQIVVSLTGAQVGEVLSVSGSLAGIDSVTGGTGGSALTINLTDTATLAEVKAIVEAIKYQSTGDIVTGTRNITVNLYDAQGSSQDGNIQSGGDAGASRLSASIAATVTVTEQNDPPSISGSPSITAKEDIDYVFQVSDFNFTQTGGESALDTELGQITVKSLPDGAKGDLLLQTGTDGNGDPVYSAVTANQIISAQDIADGKLIYRSDLNLNQSQADNSFTYSVWDKGHASDTTIRESADGTMQINVDQQNDAPVLDATNKTASATESSTSATGTDPVQIVSGVSLTDIDLSTTDGLSVFGKGTLTVEIVGATTATKEYLTLSGSLPAGVTVVDSQGNPISLSSTVGDNKLVFSLDADTTAAEVQSLMESLRYHTESDVLDGARTVKFTINDGNNEQTNGNTAGGPTSLEATLNATVTITEVNDPPAGGDQTVVTLEDTDYALKVSDFNYTQPGDETDTFKAVRIDTLPGSGTLKLNGVAITAGTVVSVADITSGNLVYSPAANVNGDAAATFTFSVQDSRDGFDTSPNTITVDITPQNDAPTFNDTVGVVTSVNESTAANTGTSPVAIITGANIGDIDLSTTGALSSTVYGAGKITVAVTGATSADQLTLASGDRPGGVTVTGGNNGAALVITLDADTTVSEVNAILNAIKYASTSDTASGERVITTTLSDGHATSDDGNVQSGGNAGGPDALSVDLVSKITIVEQNDPPASSDNTVTTNEDTTYVIKVSDFNYTQPGGENDTLGGVTINSITGTGTFKLDGNAITAPKFVTFAEINAGKLVYEPVANENGDARAEINFTVQDSRGLDATSSSDLTVNVTPQNDAPTFNNTVGVVTSVNESTDANKGVPATAIITGANIGDIDLSTTGALSGTVYGEGKITVAITSADASEQLTIDTSVLTGSALPSGVVVTGGVNGANLVITLDNDTTIAQVNEILNAIRYSTTSDTFTGGERTITTTLSDGKVSTDDGNVQAGGNAGGPDALSVDLISKITVVEQNDPPASSDNTVTTNEDTTYVIKVSDFNYTQPGGENDTLGGVTINSITGTGTFKLDGNAITAPKFVTFAEINAGKLVYEPVANENGDARAEINFTVQDSRGLDATSSSDLTVNITPQNDAPTFNNTVGVVT
ncbi:cadherin-like domain-containing protein, partial [Thalassospira marina]